MRGITWTTVHIHLELEIQTHRSANQLNSTLGDMKCQIQVNIKPDPTAQF